MHSFDSEEIFMSYIFVSPRKNTQSFNKYIFDDVLTLLHSFPLSNLTRIRRSLLSPVIPAELWWISEVGWPYEIGRRARAELGRTEASPEG